MRLLLDTHIVVWAALDPDSLNRSRARTDGRRRNAARALGCGGVGAEAEVAQLPHFGELLPLTARHAAAVLSRPLGHRDPFDELLLVQAQEEGMRLLTRDTRLAGHPFAIPGGQD